MTTTQGRAFCIQRLSDAPDLAALQRVWEGLADDYKRDPAVQQHKDALKANLGRAA